MLLVLTLLSAVTSQQMYPLVFILAFICLYSTITLVEGSGVPSRKALPSVVEGPAESQGTGPSLSILAPALILLLLLGLIIVPNFMATNRPRPAGQLTACKSNLKNIGTALEMYSTDFNGDYPFSLDNITPSYLKSIPTCASAGRVTYVYLTGVRNQCYTVYCAGGYHAKILKAPNYPMYDSFQGLINP